jgi:ElaA protein
MSIKISAHELHQFPANKWHEVLQLRSQVFVVEQACVYLDPDPSDAESIHITLTEEGKLKAYLRVYGKHPTHLGRIVVSAESRGKGYAKSLIEWTLNECLRQNRKDIEMSAQVYLTDFYRSFGFQPSGSMYLEDGIPHVRMVYQKI